MISRDLRITRPSFKLVCSAVLFSCLFFQTSVVLADPLSVGSGAIYKLNPDSSFLEGCFPPCLCPQLEQRNVGGTYNLIYDGFKDGIETYRVADVNWTVYQSDIPLRITGVGKYQIGSPDPSTVVKHRMILELKVGDDAVERFDSGWITIESANNVNIVVSINGMYCWDRVISIFSSKVPADQIRHYSLVGGSTFQRGCFDPCDCILEPELRMVGDFALVALDENSFMRVFSVVNVNWQVLSDTVNGMIPITGYGNYQVPAGFSIDHHLGLELIVGNEQQTHFDSGPVAGGTEFPKIDAVVSINGIECYDTVLHIVAGPVGGNICGGLAGIPCDLDTEFCKLPVGHCCCDYQGKCTPIADMCADYYDPVCGCDGVTYGNECEADAASVSIDHWGMCTTDCEPAPDGSACKSSPCSSAVDDECVATAIHLDVSSGATTVVACNCMNIDSCHVAFGNASPFPVGTCPAGEVCKVLGTDTNNDELEDMFISYCVPTGACCSDIGGIPTPLLVCTEETQQDCESWGLFFEGVRTTCDSTSMACCLPYGENYCVDIGPVCCAAYWGVTPTDGMTCADLTNQGGCGQICGGFSYTPCEDETQFCKLPVGGCCCDIQGRCTSPPTGCPDFFDPVCGCDGATYGNECEADAVGVSIDHWGACKPVCCDPNTTPPCLEGPHCCADGTWGCDDGSGNSPCDQPGRVCDQICGGVAGIVCENPDEFCKLPTGGCCCDFQGVCTPIPPGCIELYTDPVCGCDGVTYDNECFAEIASMSIDHWGPCGIACAPMDDGSACISQSCPTVAESDCFPLAMHMDINTGALTVLHCECLNAGACHIEFGDATPFPVGKCSDDASCEIIGADTDNDGVDDTFRAVCVPISVGVCCFDFDDGPVPYDACIDLDVNACHLEGGLFHDVNTTCTHTQPCCLTFNGEEFCADLNPLCCIDSGGVPLELDSTLTCADVGVCPRKCSETSNTACGDGEFCHFPTGTCDVANKEGVCRPFPGACPRVVDPACGCDGVTYSNECEAHNAGVSIDHWGACRPVCCDPNEYINCFTGPTYCCTDGTWMCESSNGVPPCDQPGEVCSKACAGIAGIVCKNTDEFCKLPTGGCCCDFQGVCTPFPDACPEIYSPVCGCDGMTYDNECFAEAVGMSINHGGACETCAAVRVLSDTQLSYCSGVQKTIRIELHLSNSITAIAIEDTIPAGWGVVNISDGGTFDTANGKVKWGPLFAPFPFELTYDVVPPSDEDGLLCFTGIISLDGVDQPICGEECVTRICCPDMPFMAADLPQQVDCADCPISDCTSCQDDVCQNGQLSLCEMTSYACAWKKGCNDSISDVARAAYIWRNGECYCWDDDQQNWFPTDCTLDSPGCCTNGSIASDANIMNELRVSEPGLTSVAVRSYSDTDRRTSRFRTLEISIDAPIGSMVMALEIQVPKGVQVTQISDGGEWDSSNRKIKWGPFFDHLSRTLTVNFDGSRIIHIPKTNRSTTRSLVKGFDGTVSFDGNNYSISFE